MYSCLLQSHYAVNSGVPRFYIQVTVILPWLLLDYDIDLPDLWPWCAWPTCITLTTWPRTLIPALIYNLDLPDLWPQFLHWPTTLTFLAYDLNFWTDLGLPDLWHWFLHWSMTLTYAWPWFLSGPMTLTSADLWPWPLPDLWPSFDWPMTNKD